MGTIWKPLLAMTVLSLSACEGIVNGLFGSMQPSDAEAATYLIVQPAASAAQPLASALTTIVNIQSAGGDRIAVRLIGATAAYVNIPSQASIICAPVAPEGSILPLLVSSPNGESFLEATLMQSGDAGLECLLDGNVSSSCSICPGSSPLMRRTLTITEPIPVINASLPDAPNDGAEDVVPIPPSDTGSE